MSDVPLGAFLSGGVDSSIVVATMATSPPRRCALSPLASKTVVGSMSGPTHKWSRALRTDHMEFVVKPKAVELIEELLWHHDQPFGDSSAIPTYLLSQCTRGNVTVALSGDGGDELFAGYERFAAGLLFANYLALPRPVRQRWHGPPIVYRTPRARAEWTASAACCPTVIRALQTFANWVAYLPEPVRVAMVGKERERGKSLREYQAVWAGSPPALAQRGCSTSMPGRICRTTCW